MSEIYEFRLPGRRPVVVVFAVVLSFLLWVALKNSAPWYVWAIWGVTAAMLGYMIVWNPVSGLQLTDTHLTLSPWSRRPRRIPLADIDHIKIVDWSDSTDVEIHLVGGEVVQTFSGDIPPISTFEAAATARGLHIERS